MELKLAILVCDSTIPSIEKEEGSYERIFTTFLHAANASLSTPHKLIIDAFDVFDDCYPQDITVYDGVILSGSNADAFSDDDDWIVDLADYISGLVNSFSCTKVIGVCFGHQILARALGGVVERGFDKEMGSTEVQVVNNDLAEKYFGITDKSFRILQAHRDVVTTVPPSLTNVASSDRCANQAFVRVRDGSVQCWSVQVSLM